MNRRLVAHPRRSTVLRRLRSRAERGGALIEFALSLPLLIILISGSTDYGLLLKEHSVMVEAAYAGARAASQQPAGVAPADIASTAELTAAMFIQQARLDPLDYSIQVHPVSIPVAFGSPAPAVQVTLTRQGQGRAPFLRFSGFTSCVKSIAVLQSGEVLPSMPPGSSPNC